MLPVMIPARGNAIILVLVSVYLPKLNGNMLLEEDNIRHIVFFPGGAGLMRPGPTGHILAIHMNADPTHGQRRWVFIMVNYSVNQNLIGLVN